MFSVVSFADDWPGWRGPHAAGVSEEKGLPVKWSATENVRWKVRVPGAGVSAPVVWKGRVFLTSSEGRQGERLHLFCYGAAEGRLLWHDRFFGSAVSEGQFTPGGMAVPTPATDGKRVYALFGTGDLVCVDLDGKPVWVRSLAQEYGPFRNRWGMAASPLLVEGLLVVQVDHWGGSYLLGVDPATGANRWRTPRERTVGWSSPVAWEVGGRTQVVATGNHTVKGYSADTGKELWGFRGLQMQCIPTPVAHRGRLYLSSGQDFTSLCFEPGAGGRGKPHVAWKAPSKGSNVPSPVCLGDYYYFVEDAGFVSCLRADSGERVWRRRLAGKVQASPVAGEGKLYFAGTSGVVTVVRAGPEFKALARNELGEGVVASPALSGGCVFLRGEQHLFCIGPPLTGPRPRR